jgi:hypothetical protein
MLRMVWVAVNKQGRPIRILKGTPLFEDYPDEHGFRFMRRSEAVEEIRDQVYDRSKGFCRNCGDIILLDSFHMHEVKHRGKGGEISLDNSIALCAKCHIGPEGEHKARRTRFGE